MKPSNLALHTLLLISASTKTTAFTSPAFLPSESKSNVFVPSTSHIFPTLSPSRSESGTASSAYIGDDYDAIPPSSYNNNSNRDKVSDEEEEPKKYVQKMSAEERTANLEVMTQIFRHDLKKLLLRQDYAGWLEAKRDLNRREANDPWFELNSKMKEAVQMGDEEEAKKLQILIDEVGGPPPNVKHRRQYADLFEIYKIPMSLSRAESIIKQDEDRRKDKLLRQRAKQEANEKKTKEADLLEERYKKEREAHRYKIYLREKAFQEAEEKRKKAVEKAEKILAENEDIYANGIEGLLKRDVEKIRIHEYQKRLETKGLPITEDVSKTSDNMVLPPRRKVTYSENGRPRVPGDRDVTMGEIAVDHISETSDKTTGYVRIQVNSFYNSNESDAAVRKHTFQYTVQITNMSPTETIQLIGRRFEIQTVGTSKKDLVEGEGVTGRQPILKPGGTFNYTSLAPLNVRPLGTTIAAARMRGTYIYKVVSGETVGDGVEKDAELGTFHFVFPPDQRVKPFVGKYDDEDDEDELDETMSNQI